MKEPLILIRSYIDRLEDLIAVHNTGGRAGTLISKQIDLIACSFASLADNLKKIIEDSELAVIKEDSIDITYKLNID